MRYFYFVTFYFILIFFFIKLMVRFKPSGEWNNSGICYSDDYLEAQRPVLNYTELLPVTLHIPDGLADLPSIFFLWEINFGINFLSILERKYSIKIIDFNWYFRSSPYFRIGYGGHSFTAYPSSVMNMQSPILVYSLFTLFFFLFSFFFFFFFFFLPLFYSERWLVYD